MNKDGTDYGMQVVRTYVHVRCNLLSSFIFGECCRGAGRFQGKQA